MILFQTCKSVLNRSLVLVVTLTCTLTSAPTNATAQLTGAQPLPWPNDPITVSFAPDWVEIGRYRNELRQHLNNQLSYPDWQVEILRAFQTWARHCDIQVALSADSNRAFGVPGLAQGDPRFGDVRIGAFPQENVLGNAVPFNYESGTWAGDIFLDTTRLYEMSDGQSSSGSGYDLFTVMLHEAGNSLGLLDNEQNIESAMFFTYAGPKVGLSQADIDNIQFLYGPPSLDPFEPAESNDRFELATAIPLNGDFSQQLIATATGRIQHRNDYDVYRFQGTSLSENCWVKLRVMGRSLLCGQITIYDAEFNEMDTIAAESPLLNTIGKEITNVAPGETIYVVVEWSGVPDFDFGNYELALDFNENGGAELEGLDKFDEFVDEDDSFSFLEAEDDAITDLLYDAVGLIDLETNENNSFARAVDLLAPSGIPAGTRYEVVSTLATPSDVDTYRIVTAADATGTLVVNLAPLGLEAPLFTVVAYDANRKSLPVKRYFRVTGEVAAEVQNIAPNSTVYLRVRGRRGNSVGSNYLLTADVATRNSALMVLQQAALSASNSDRFGAITTSKTQLFKFQLNMSSSDTRNQACQLTIYNDQGRVELVTSVRSGQSRDAYAWLQAGTHIVRLTALSQNRRPIADSNVTLRAAAISDDKGPILVDPSGNPVSGTQDPNPQPPPPPTWEFPFVDILELIIPLELPW